MCEPPALSICATCDAPNIDLAHSTVLPSLLSSDKAPVLCFVTTGDRTMRTLLRVTLATLTFLVFFYSTTIAMSLMYALDLALLKF
jgi:hypothetical protein